MKAHSRQFMIGLAMLAAAGLALALIPRHKMSEQAEINLETLIPKRFGQWKHDISVAPTIHDPGVQANIEKSYNQYLDRVYVNAQGERVMLAVAYGGGQTGSVQVHRPEVCYPALGFQIGALSKDVIDANGTQLPVMKLVATQGARIEPVTYWVMMGETAVRGHLEQVFARLKYNLEGKVPYGILIRVSTISTDESQSYRIEEQFVRDMLRAVPAQHRKVLSGAD